MFGLFKSKGNSSNTASSNSGGTAVAEPEPQAAPKNAEPPIEVKPQPPVKTAEELEQERLAGLRAEVEAGFIAIDQLTPKFTSSANHRTPQVIQEEIAQQEALKQELQTRHQTAVKQLLPVEAALKEDLDKEHNRLSHECWRKINELNRELVPARIDEKYQRIDMSFLSRRKWSEKYKCALPLFAVFDIKSDSCQLTSQISRDDWHRFHDSLSSAPVLAKHFNFEPLRKMAQEAFNQHRYYGVSATITARFTGAIPQPVRDRIRQATGDFDAILLVTEAPEWELSLKPIPQPITRDPLVIGQKGENFWLITAFDTTPAEEYVKREFTIGENKS
jgi:hypothetical protein